MKFWATLTLLAAAGCSTAPPPEPSREPLSAASREMVDRLRVDTAWHPPSTGGQGLSCSYEFPDSPYPPQVIPLWPCYPSRACGWERPSRWSRGGCRPIPACPGW